MSGPIDHEQRYQQAPCGYLTTDDDGSISDVNDPFLAWTGYRRQELLGTRIQKLMPMGDQLLYSTHCIPQLRLSGTVSEVAMEIVNVNKVRRAALLTAARASEPGKPAEVQVIIFIAHERRKYEIELVEARRRAEESEARRADAEAGLAHLALHDARTGLPNRAGLSDILDAAFAERSASGPQLALLFLDLDHFKAVDDSLGHSAVLLSC